MGQLSNGGRERNEIWHKGSLEGRRTKCIAAYDVRCSEGTWDMTSVVVTALCNQPEASASDLGDDQSR